MSLSVNVLAKFSLIQTTVLLTEAGMSVRIMLSTHWVYSCLDPLVSFGVLSIPIHKYVDYP